MPKEKQRTRNHGWPTAPAIVALQHCIAYTYIYIYIYNFRFLSGIHGCSLHGPMGRVSYTYEFHSGMHCVVYVPIGGGYNATHSQVEFTAVTCIPPRGVQVIAVNSTWECVALCPLPMGRYTMRCIPKWNS